MKYSIHSKKTLLAVIKEKSATIKWLKAGNRKRVKLKKKTKLGSKVSNNYRRSIKYRDRAFIKAIKKLSEPIYEWDF